MFVCLSVGMWRANGNPNPCTVLNEILHTHPHLSKEGFGAGLTPGPSPIWAWGIWNPKSWSTHFWKLQKQKVFSRSQVNACSAEYFSKLIIISTCKSEKFLCILETARNETFFLHRPFNFTNSQKKSCLSFKHVSFYSCLVFEECQSLLFFIWKENNKKHLSSCKNMKSLNSLCNVNTNIETLNFKTFCFN